MQFLTNLSNYSAQMGWFDNDYRQIERFLQRSRLDGIELIFHGNDHLDTFPRGSVKGIHLSYWPVWLDYWRQDKKELLRQFGSMENVEAYYGGQTKDAMVNRYRLEMARAKEFGADYLVFHVSHVQMEHVYTFDFTYGSREILFAAAELVNEAFGEKDAGMWLLFENLWWPGLNFLDADLTGEFFQLIKYPRKGFMLDIGHLMITNPDLHNENQACSYILDTIHNLGSLKQYIKGIHLNKSFPGEYLRRDHSSRKEKMARMENIWDKYMAARDHVLEIDKHVPFDHPGIGNIIGEIGPEFVVYEFLSGSLAQLEDMIAIQNKALNK